MAWLQDAAAAAVAALEAEQAANSNGKDTETGEEEEEDDDDSPITVTVTSGSTQYIAMAGTVISILLLNFRETKREKEAGKERERLVIYPVWNLVEPISCMDSMPTTTLTLSISAWQPTLSLSLSPCWLLRDTFQLISRVCVGSFVRSLYVLRVRAQVN